LLPASKNMSKLIHNSRGNNLALLLDSFPVGRVLVLGKLLQGWEKIFIGSSYSPKFSFKIEDFGIYDIILYHCSCAKSNKELKIQLTILQRLVTASGWVIIFAPNIYSFLSFKNKKNTHRPVKEGLDYSLIGYRRILKEVGIVEYKECLALPSLGSIEELVTVGSRFLELPHYWHPLIHLARLCKIFPLIADGFIFFAGRLPIERGLLLGKVGNLLQSCSRQLSNTYTIERLDLRIRGAMVLFLVEKESSQHLIVRVVSDHETDKVVRRNQEFLKLLQHNSDLPDELKTLLPYPYGECDLNGSIIYVESLMTGAPAWKVNRVRLRKHIQDEAEEFIFRLQISTSRKIRLDNDKLDNLFAIDKVCLADCTLINRQLYERILEAIQAIRQRLVGQTVFFVVSHGDYGYGNILVDPKTGQLKGVIDWDTGRKDDLPGIDYLNLLVQKYRSEWGYGVDEAFIQACSEVIHRGELDEKGFYRSQFDIFGELLSTILYCGFIRYMSRAAQYPDVFAMEQEGYLKILSFLEDYLPL
jgi:hypothetical protein